MVKQTNITPNAIDAQNHLLGSIEMNRAIMQARDTGAADQSLAVAQADGVNAQALAAVAGISKDIQIS